MKKIFILVLLLSQFSLADNRYLNEVSCFNLLFSYGLSDFDSAVVRGRYVVFGLNLGGKLGIGLFSVEQSVFYQFPSGWRPSPANQFSSSHELSLTLNENVLNRKKIKLFGSALIVPMSIDHDSEIQMDSAGWVIDEKNNELQKTHQNLESVQLTQAEQKSFEEQLVRGVLFRGIRNIPNRFEMEFKNSQELNSEMIRNQNDLINKKLKLNYEQNSILRKQNFEIQKELKRRSSGKSRITPHFEVLDLFQKILKRCDKIEDATLKLEIKNVQTQLLHISNIHSPLGDPENAQGSTGGGAE